MFIAPDLVPVRTCSEEYFSKRLLQDVNTCSMDRRRGGGEEEKEEEEEEEEVLSEAREETPGSVFEAWLKSLGHNVGAATRNTVQERARHWRQTALSSSAPSLHALRKALN